jgi:LDH2 family malate/lactate/ureidoglycolate dehydrogenase
MQYKELLALIESAARKYVSEDEARYFAVESLETSIRKPRHLANDSELVKDIESWVNKKADPVRKIDLPGYTQYDFNGLGPSLKIKEIHDTLVTKAQTNGIAMASIINSGGMHTLHLWTQGLAKRGLFALGAWNGGPDAVIPHNGTKGIFGTNPMTYAFPSDKGEVVIDMATSEIPYFKIVGAKKSGSPLPSNAAVDSAGLETSVASSALDEAGVSNLLPMGGSYKGYAINYLMEIMTSALIGARVSSEMSDDYIEVEHGGFIIAIDIDKITDRKKYDASVLSINTEIRSHPAKDGTTVIVPGDTNRRLKEAMTETTDIPVEDGYVAQLRELAR